MAEKTAPAPKADAPAPSEPAAPKLPSRAALADALATAGKTLKLSGHVLLAKLAESDVPPSLAQVAHDVAFAVNTGLAPAAAAGLRALGAEKLADLLLEILEAQLDQDGVTALLRERFPEPRRPGAPAQV